MLNCNAGYPPGVEVRIVTSETLTAEPFVSGLFFGECPRWHDGRLWYSDFFDHAVFSVSPDGERRVEVDFDGEPAGLGWLPDGRLLINSRLDRVIIRREPDGTLVEHGDLRPWATWHANDMVVASNGQAYSGNFGFDLDGLYDGTVEPSAIATASLDPRRPRRHQPARRPTTSSSRTARSSPRTAPRSSSPRASAAG